MSDKKFVKLGKKVEGIFFDPNTRLKVLPGQVKELVGKQNSSKLVHIALEKGHLVSATEAEFKKANANSPAPSKKEEAPEKVEEVKEEEVDTEEVDTDEAEADEAEADEAEAEDDKDEAPKKSASRSRSRGRR